MSDNKFQIGDIVMVRMIVVGESSSRLNCYRVASIEIPNSFYVIASSSAMTLIERVAQCLAIGEAPPSIAALDDAGLGTLLWHESDSYAVKSGTGDWLRFYAGGFEQQGLLFSRDIIKEAASWRVGWLP